MGGVNIPLEANNLRIAPPVDPLQEYARAAALQTEAGQQQIQQQQVQALSTGNQQAQLDLQDQQKMRSLAPQFVQKDKDGNITGYDSNGYYAALMGGGVSPQKITAMQNAQAEATKNIAGATKAQLDTEQDRNQQVTDTIEAVRDAAKKAAAPAGSSAVPSLPGAPASLPGTPTIPPIPNAAPGAPGVTPVSAQPGIAGSGAPNAPGSVSAAAPSASSAAIIPDEAQKVYQAAIPKLLRLGVPPNQLPPQLMSLDQLDQAEVGPAVHKQMLADGATQAKTSSDNAKAAVDNAEAGLKNIQLRLASGASPHMFDADVDGIYPPNNPNTAGMNMLLKGQINGALGRGDVDTAKKFIASALDSVQSTRAAIQKETDPAVINAKVGEGVATEVAKQNALAPPLQQITNTTRAGRQYISREDIPQGSAGVTEKQAAAVGIPVVDTATAGTLQEIDTAKANQDFMLSQIGKKLATDPTGRLFSAPANTIEKLAQTDPELAAMGTYRNAAIQSMRAVAGSKGLRINQNEIQMAIDNDIPRMTDTLPVAQQKLTNLKTFLDNSEAAHLSRNRVVTPPAPGAPQTAGHSVGDLIVQNGHTFKATQVDNNGKVLAADPQ